MRRLLVVRAANAVLVLLVSSMMIFLVISMSGDPLAELRDRQPPVPVSVVQAEETRLGLDQPLPTRYLTWLGGIVKGDFGPSVLTTKDIGVEVGERIGVTLRLVIVGMVVSMILSVIAGTVSGLRKGRWPDVVITPAAFFLLAMPSFWLAVLLKQGGIGLNEMSGYQLFYTVGAESVPAPTEFLPRLADAAGHLVLPTIVLALVHFAVWSRYQRAAIIESLAGDHVRFAILKGLPRKRVVRAYVVRPALVPIVTMVALDMPVILSGAIITETVFQWRGMGVFLLESIALRDVNAVLAWLMIAALAVVAFNLIADLLYGLLDPRVRDARQ